MIKAIIIDDEPLAHAVIEEYAKEVPFIHIKQGFHLATDALTWLKTESVDLIFLDIEMPLLKGLDFLKLLNPQPHVIVTSAYKQYALESYDEDVTDYLLKPFRFDRFLKAAHKVYDLHQLKQGQANTSVAETVSTPEHILLKVDGKLIQTALNDVHYLESYGNYIKVWNGDSFHLVSEPLTHFIKQLPGQYFARAHRSYAINRNYIQYIEGNIVRMTNGASIPLGRNYRAEFKNWFLGC